MKEKLIKKIEELIEEYENECNVNNRECESINEYYGGKADALKEVLELIKHIE